MTNDKKAREFTEKLERELRDRFVDKNGVMKESYQAGKWFGLFGYNMSREHIKTLQKRVEELEDRNKILAEGSKELLQSKSEKYTELFLKIEELEAERDEALLAFKKLRGEL